MNHRMRSLIHKGAPAILAVIGIIAFGGAAARAQTWEGLYGGLGTENGHGQVIPVTNTPGGGYVIGGFSTSPSLIDPDIYLTKVDNNGTLLWTKTYDVSAGQADAVNDILELPNGSFVLTGVISTKPTTYNDPNTGDIFIMKVDANGEELWTKHYGGSLLDFGSSITTDPDNGDIIVAGTTLSFGAAPSGTPFFPAPPLPPPSVPLDPVPQFGDAFLLRTDPNGNILWMRTFGGELADGFNSVIVSTNDPVNQKNIIAAGYSENFVLQGGSYVKQIRPFIVRVDPQGLIGVMPLTNSIIANGAGLPPASLNCIRQVPSGNDFIAVGNTSLNGDVYLLRVNNNLTQLRDWRIGQTNGLEHGKWLDFRQNATYDPNPADMYPGEFVPVVAASRMNPNAGGFMDVWAFEVYLPPFPAPKPFPPPPPAAVLWSNIYGGPGSEEAVSIAYVFPAGGPPPIGRTQGFIISGLWANNVPPNPLGLQSYLLKTTVAGVTGCETPVLHAPVAMSDAAYPVVPETYRVRTQCETEPDKTFGSYDQTLICPLCLLCKPSADPGEDISNVEGSADGNPIDVESLRAYPNPVVEDDRFNVEYRLSDGAETVVTVTDMVGREVYRTVRSNPAGPVTLEIPVGEWAAGTYLVKVAAAEGASAVRQIVVGGK